MKKHNSFTKKVFSVLLSLAMVLTMMPVSTFAAEEDSAVMADAAENAVENAVAEVTASDGTVIGQYASLNDAITAAQDSDGSTVKLLADTTVTSYLNITGGHYTVDLNGKTVTTTSNHCFYLNDSSVNVTIKNGTLVGVGTKNSDVVIVFRKAAVTLENVTATANGSYPVCVMVGTVTIYGGECGTADKKNGIYVDKGTTVKLYGGTYHAIWTQPQENYIDYSSLLPEGYIFMQRDDSGEYTKYIDPGTMGTDDGNQEKQKNVYHIRVVKCTHSGSLDADGKCLRCGLTHEHTAPNAKGQCETCNQRIVAQSGTQYYTDLSGAITAANGAEITLLQVFGENVTVADGAAASILLGNGGTVEGEGTYPYYWIAMNHGIPLTMNGGSITLKDGAMGQYGNGASGNTAVVLNGGTLTVESSVTMIAGGKQAQQQPAIEATGGTLALQGNTHLEGGLSMSGDAALAHKLTEGIFTNGVEGSVSVDGHNTYNSVFDLLETGYAFAIYNADGTIGAAIDKDTSVKKLTEDVAVIACTHKDAKGGNLFVKGTCSRCGLTCTKHKYDADTENCETCGQTIVAQDGQHNYVSLNEAFEQVESGRTISAVATLPEESLTFGNNKTVTLILSNWSATGNADDTATLTVTGGELTIINGAEGSSAVNNPAVITNKGKGFAVSVTGGKLVFGGKAAITGGLQVIDGGGLEGGLKEGSILIKGSGTQMGESAYSVSVRDHANNTNYGTVLDLLAPGCAFAKYNKATGETGELVSGNEASLNEDVIVVAHPAHDMKLDSASGKYVCVCGFVCEHDQGFTDGKCDICGAACTHPSDKVSESGGTTTCGVCKTQMVVKVEKGDTTTYYAEHHDEYGTEDTLRLIDNLESGSTVTLLADNLFAGAYVYRGRTITLDLNGKTLTETIQGITVGQGDQDDTSTDNKLIVKGMLGEGETAETGNYAFRTWEGGELNLEALESGGRIGSIIADGGKLTTGASTSDIKIGTLDILHNNTELSFSTGTFDKIIYSDMDGGSVMLGDLLAKDSSCAFRYTTGDKAFVPYNTEITGSNAVENVTITGCDHRSITGNTCDYCGMKNVAGLCYQFVYGEWVSSGTYYGTSSEEAGMNQGANNAIKGWGNTFGGKLKLFTDATLDDITITNRNATVIDLNGHRITGGTLTLDKDVNLTITDESTGRNGSFANVTVNAGASLTVDSGISVGRITASDKTAKITLKEGSRFTGYDKLWGMALMDWVEDGYCIKDGDNYKDLKAVGTLDQGDTANSGSYMITKAPATITASNRTGEIEHGAKVSASFLPTITNTSGTTPDYYFIQWYRRTENDVLSLGDGTLRDGTFTYGGTGTRFEGVNVGDTLDVFCTIRAFKDNGSQFDTILWQTAVKDYKLTVTRGKAAVETVPTAIAGLRYTGSTQELITKTGKANGGEMQYSLDGTNYSADIPQGTDAREYTVWYKAVGDSNHDDSEPQSMKVKIAPMLLSTMPYIGSTTLTIRKGYDGTAGASIHIDGFVKNGGQMDNDGDRVALTQGVDFTVDAKYDNPNVGTRKTVLLTFEMKNPNYAFADANARYETKGSIMKASADGLTTPGGSLTIANRTAADYTYGLSQLLPELSGSCSYGSLRYTAGWKQGSVAQGFKVKDDDISIKDGVLTLKIVADAVEANSPRDVGLITVKVSSTNYEDFTLTIDVDSDNLKLPQGEPVLSTDTLTYGDTLSKIKLSGTMKDGDTTVEGTFAWGNPDAKVGPVGDYAAAWTFTPADKKTYAEITGVAKITVQKAVTTGTPKYTPITGEGQTLADANLTSVGENNESVFKASGKTVEGIVKWVRSEDKSTELDLATMVEQGKAYTWLFIPYDGNDYTSLTGSITLWNMSSGGGGTSTPGGGGGAVAPATPDNDVITEKDSMSGIATKTTIKETKTETTKNKQGQTVSKITATVSKEISEELVKQAVDHKSETVEITVKSDTATAAADSVKSTELKIPKTTVEEITKNTDADLVINTDSGQVVLDHKTLETIAKKTGGNTVTITVSENTKLTKAQKSAEPIVGKNGKLFDLVVSIGGKLIHDFDGGKAYVILPMPENLKGKDIVVIYISDRGFCSILKHTVTTVGTDSYIKFITPHFSTFAVVEKSKTEKLIKAQNKACVKKLMKKAKFQVRTKKTSGKSVRITVTPENDKSLIKDIESMGYTVKYRFYRSTKKNSGYKLLKTRTTNTYTSTAGKKGTKYYYKVQILIYDGKTLIARSELR